ncbi:unnamed protein product [Acanthosepion pharaonis]|uniref:Reverse transcriptase n=1 Tax=Acanthosepion pharaonis TaxID=158019 RepID=A0A812EK38_ACAPH|nr:unnamed protein product [Sepia pharaonis]
MRDSKIITLYKKKGQRSDCNNYKGISLLSVGCKVFARVILVRLQKLAERIYPKSQCGFHTERSTIGMVFSPLPAPEVQSSTDAPHAFGTSTEGIYLRTRSDGGLFNLARLRSRTNVHETLVRKSLCGFRAERSTIAFSLRQLQESSTDAPVRFHPTTSLCTKTPCTTPGEDTPASPLASIQHAERQLPVICYHPIGVNRCAREIFGSHWTGTARLKLGSTQPVRLCPATV